MYSFERNSRVYMKSADDADDKRAPANQATSSQARDSCTEVGEVVSPNSKQTKAQVLRQIQETQEVAKKADPNSGVKSVMTHRKLKKTTTITRADAPEIDVTKPLKDIEDEISRLEKINDATDKFNLKLDEIRRKLDELEHRLNSMAPVAKDNDTLQRQLAEMHDFMQRLNALKGEIDDVAMLGEQLISDNLAADPRIIRAGVKDVQNQWASLDKRAKQRIKDIEDAMKARKDFDKEHLEYKQLAQDIADWLDNAKNILINEEHVNGDLDTVCVLIEQHRAFQEVFSLMKPSIDDLKRKAQKLLASPMANSREIKQIESTVSIKIDELNKLIKNKTADLQQALEKAKAIKSLTTNLIEVLAKAEQSLALHCGGSKPLSDDEDVCKKQIAAADEVSRELSRNAALKDQLEQLERKVLSECHPDGELPVKYWSNVVSSRWAEIDALAKQTSKRLEKHARALKEKLANTEELIKYLSKHEVRLLDAKVTLNSSSAARLLESLLNEHQSFADELKRRDSQVNEIVAAFAANNNASSLRTVLQTNANKEPTGKQTLALGKSEASASVSFASYRDKYPLIRHARAQLMLSKWRSVWQFLLDNLQAVACLLNAARKAEQGTNNARNQTKQLTPEEVIASELRRLNISSMKIYHVGDGKYRFGESQVLRPVRISPTNENKIEVRNNKQWQGVDEFLRYISEPSKISTFSGPTTIRSLA